MKVPDDEKDRSDIDDVILEETRRGRRPVDQAALRKRRELLRDLRWLLDFGEETEFLKAIRALGLQDGSPEFLNAVQLWRRHRAR